MIKPALYRESQAQDVYVRELDLTLSVKEALIEAGQDERVSFRDAGEVFVVYRRDLQKAVAMGLADLPIESIAVQETSPILHTRNLELRQTLDISNQLTDYFPGYLVAALYELQSLVKRGGFSAYVIGGNVRDILLYKDRLLDIRDVDLTIEGDAISSSQFIVANSRNFVVDGCFPEFGTVKVRYKDNIQFDLASTRKEIYRSCSALPEVVELGVPLAEDIIRRDFTCNALALSVHDLGKILDHSHGIEDVESRKIRVLHPLSFFEDPSRILRALKFASRLDFTMSRATERLIRQFLKHGYPAYNGGGDRIKQELKEFLWIEETPIKRYWSNFFVEQGGLRLVNMTIPFSKPSSELAHQQDRLLEQYSMIVERMAGVIDESILLWELHLCFLFQRLEPTLFQETAHRLGLTKSERELVEKYIKIIEENPLEAIREYSQPAEIYDIFSERPLSSIIAGALTLYLEDPERLKIILHALKTFKRKFEAIRPELNGNDLQELGVPKGEAIGLLLKELLHAKLSGRLKDRMAEVRYIQSKLEPADTESEAVNLSVALSSEATGPKPVGLKVVSEKQALLKGKTKTKEEGPSDDPFPSAD